MRAAVRTCHHVHARGACLRGMLHDMGSACMVSCSTVVHASPTYAMLAGRLLQVRVERGGFPADTLHALRFLLAPSADAAKGPSPFRLVGAGLARSRARTSPGQAGPWPGARQGSRRTGGQRAGLGFGRLCMGAHLESSCKAALPALLNTRSSPGPAALEAQLAAVLVYACRAELKAMGANSGALGANHLCGCVARADASPDLLRRHHSHACAQANTYTRNHARTCDKHTFATSGTTLEEDATLLASQRAKTMSYPVRPMARMTTTTKMHFDMQPCVLTIDDVYDQCMGTAVARLLATAVPPTGCPQDRATLAYRVEKKKVLTACLAALQGGS